MPIFEYTCEDCAQRAEILVQGNQQPTCPHCGSVHLHKELSLFAATGGGDGTKSMSAAPAHPGGCPCCVGPGGTCGLN